LRQPADWLIQAANAVGTAPQPFGYSDRDSLPSAPAVYFVEADGFLLYVGSTANVRVRWRSHHRAKELAAAGRIWVIETADYARWEKVLIRRLSPRFNGKTVRDTPLTAEHVRRVRAELESIRSRMSRLFPNDPAFIIGTGIKS
jgi:hypothetical protein